MITFWVPEQGAFSIQLYLERQREALAGKVTVRHYEALGPRVETVRGTHIFAGLEMLTPSQCDAVASLREQLARLQPGLPLLNDPYRVLHRMALLQRLAQEGINRFRVYPATDATAVSRFPVFVRHQTLHTGSLTNLINTPAELGRALTRLRLRAHRLRDLLIVEYCHTRDAEGYFRKYAAHRLGDRIVPVHLIAGSEWMLKSDDDFPDVPRAREALAHAEGNLHQEWLERVFAIAGVEFGRIDYGVLAGVPQAWEINLNPTMTRTQYEKPKELPPDVAAIRGEAARINHIRLLEAWLALDTAEPADPLTLTVEPRLLARVGDELAGLRRREALRRLLDRVYEHRQIGAPVRALYSRVFRRL